MVVILITIKNSLSPTVTFKSPISVSIWAARAPIKKHTSVQTFVMVAHKLISAPHIFPYRTTHLGSKMALSGVIYLNL